ncbi:MAG: DUF2135 domain-containing protein [Treponema sp.]|nr:DUF2135 domain-containing protein [Treponema sp.]
MNRFAMLFSFLVPSMFAAGQLVAQTAVPAAPSISMKVSGSDPNKASPVRLSTLGANVEVMGNIATTTLDMTFVNETDRILEGEFEFPLGEGESVTGYALDINGKMRQGVVVEKDKGRQVFEAVVRQGIDPGLVEMTAGNNFKARVYPIPAKGSRHVQVTYQSELRESASAGRVYSFSALPQGKLDSFDFKITVLDTASPSAPAGDDFGLGPITFDQMRSGYSASISKKDFTLTKPVKFAIPSQLDNGKGKVFTQDIGKDTFFYYWQPFQTETVAKKLPKSLVVYYDISDSMKRRDSNAEFKLLAAYLSKLDNPSVTLVPFSNEVHGEKVFTGSVDKIVADIQAYVKPLGFDGATNLGYDFASLFPADEVLVMTDGLGNWDDSLAAGKTAAKRPVQPRVYTINSSASANHGWLERTARLNGGQYVNLCAKDEGLALDMLTSDPLRLITASYDTNAVSDVYPVDGSIVSGDFSLSGKLRRKSADITLQFGHGNTVEKSVTVSVSAIDGLRSDNVVYQWAVKKVAALGTDYEANKDEILETAKKYTVVTEGTSLIVLDSVQDYVRYGIVPPDELKAEYDRLVARQNTTVKPVTGESGKEIPQSIYTRFEDFRKWWNTSVEEFRRKKSSPKKGVGNPRHSAPMDDAAAGGYEMTDEAVVYMEAEAMDASPAMESMSSGSSSSMRRANGRASARIMQAEAAAPAAPAPAPGQAASGNPTVQLQAWSPNAEYLSVLKRTPTAGMFAKYLELKEQYAASPAFYMEVADYFAEEGLEKESIRILSNLAELNLENSDMLRALGNKLVERNLYALAVPVFEKLVKMRPEIPQFYRDLGMAYYYAGEEQKAVDTLYSVVYKKWDARFDEVQQIALNDMNAIIALSKDKLDTSAIDKKLLQNFDMDVRVVLTWNIDNCDVDLWVTDKDGEKCFYGNKLTANGGRMSRDFTQGYGPEEFCIKVAPGGKLKVEANYFGNHQQKLLQPVTVQAEVYTNFGRANQKREILTLQLDSVKQTFFIGDVTY